MWHLLSQRIGLSIEQYYLFSGQRSNSEKEEAVLNALKMFINPTSNCNSENLIYNKLAHIQAHQMLATNKKDKE